VKLLCILNKIHKPFLKLLQAGGNIEENKVCLNESNHMDSNSSNKHMLLTYAAFILARHQFIYELICQSPWTQD